MISIGTTGSSYTFSLYLNDKVKGATALYLKMYKGDSQTSQYCNLINTSPFNDYSEFTIDPSNLSAGDYTASIITAITGGNEVFTTRARVGATACEIPKTSFKPTNKKIVFNK